jgi:hypothetical protein
MQTQFYAYLWLRKDGTPYYAGKGCRRRAFTPHLGFFPPKNKARANSPEGKARQSKIFKGNKYGLGKSLSADRRAKISETLTGKTASAATKKKMSESHKKWHERALIKTIAWG